MKHHPSPIVIETIDQLLVQLQQCRNCFFLFDTRVPEESRKKIISALQPKITLGLPGSDEIKNLGTYQKVISWLLENEASAKDLLVVFGGGSLSDLGGFCASTYHRGMRLVLIPTTLLAMVDASIGGKNGINIGHVKNMVGTNYFPESTFICPQLLESFSHQELLVGIPEMVKHAILDSEEHFHALEDLLAHWNFQKLDDLIERSVLFKNKIVHQSKHAPIVREQLNFGHTIGHAIEAIIGPSCMHGSAILAGLLIETAIGIEVGVTDRTLYQRLQALPLHSILPEISHIPFDELFDKMVHDKKSREGEVGVVLVESIGNPLGVQFVERDILKQVWDACVK